MQEYYDIVIVGTGVAGLFCALNIHDKYKVLVITKDQLENSNSYLAQGGISTLKNKEDYKTYFEDTLKAGRYENNLIAVDLMIKSSPEIISELINLGVTFDKEGEDYAFTREGAHSTHRIMHHQDVTGKEITSKLLLAAQTRSNITLKPYHCLIDLITENNRCRGIIVVADNIVKAIYAKTVVLATGGVGGLFEHSTNFTHITGDGLAIALKHHITVKDVNYIQIHPTCLYTTSQDRKFLISEAVRGEGAYLLNIQQKRFVDELSPRDVVSMAIEDQLHLTRSSYVYLAAMHLGREKITKRFPHIYKKCFEAGYDMTKDLIPVTPAQHYFMGGIKVNMNGETSMHQLYAIGETSCNGVHGANRLASNSLLESLVFAKRAAHKLSDSLKDYQPASLKSISLSEYNLQEIKETYKKYVLQEIKRRDENFYARWCNKTYQCG